MINVTIRKKPFKLVQYNLKLFTVHPSAVMFLVSVGRRKAQHRFFDNVLLGVAPGNQQIGSIQKERRHESQEILGILTSYILQYIDEPQTNPLIESYRYFDSPIDL